VSEERLPVVERDGSGGASGAPPPPVQLESSSVRLVGTLAVAGALAGLAIVLAFQWANPRIEAWRAEVLADAVTEVLAGADRYETVFLEDDGFTLEPTADTTGLDRVYVGYGDDATPVGVALVGAAAGFQDVIRVIFGYDPDTGEVIGMRILESKETPGLGDKIAKDSSFVAGFLRVLAPLVGVKAGRERGDASEVTMITGATISSRAVIDIINMRLDGVREQVDAYWAGAVRSAGAASAAAPAATADGRAPGAALRAIPGGTP